MPALKSQRKEKFVLALFEGRSATEAYTLAGYKPCRQNAARLTTKDDIQQRLAKLQSEAARSSQVTVASLLAELEDARSQATSLKQFSAVVRSIESKARISGLLTEKIEVKTISEQFDGCRSVEDIIEVLAQDCVKDGFSEKDIEDYRALTRVWLENVANLLRAAKARPVQPMMSDQQRENVERKRLGLTPRSLTNGVKV
jgi:hypothetical protein